MMPFFKTPSLEMCTKTHVEFNVEVLPSLMRARSHLTVTASLIERWFIGKPYQSPDDVPHAEISQSCFLLSPSMEELYSSLWEPETWERHQRELIKKIETRGYIEKKGISLEFSKRIGISHRTVEWPILIERLRISDVYFLKNTDEDTLSFEVEFSPEAEEKVQHRFQIEIKDLDLEEGKYQVSESGGEGCQTNIEFKKNKSNHVVDIRIKLDASLL